MRLWFKPIDWQKEIEQALVRMLTRYAHAGRGLSLIRMESLIYAQHTLRYPYKAWESPCRPGLIYGISREPIVEGVMALRERGGIRLVTGDILPGISAHDVWVHDYLSRPVGCLPNYPLARETLEDRYDEPHWLPTLIALA